MITADKCTAVVILNWNGAEMLRRFLPSVVAHSDDARIIVADNGSTDRSEQIVTTEFPTVEWLPLPENYGFAEGYNKALAQVDADYFVLLNSDVEVTPQWLRPLLAYMAGHPEVAACQPKLLAEACRSQFEYAGGAGGFIDRYGYPFCRGRIFGVVEEDEGQYDEIVPLFWATGAALLVRRTDWVESGGLDGRFFAHMEEIDLCWRLRARNRGIVCVPQSVVYHVGGGTLQQGNPRKTYLNFRNNLLMLYKNLPAEELATVLRMRFWLDYLAALQFLLKGSWEEAKAVQMARKDFRSLLPEYAPIREENQRKAVLNAIPERWQISLLWQFYAKGRKTFKQLKHAVFAP